MDYRLDLSQMPMSDLFLRLSEVADKTGIPLYIVGGYVRDWFLYRPCTDIDFVVVGDGITFAKAAAKALGNRKVSVFAHYGTAMFRYHDAELEFVGARKESYSPDSRNPDVSPGTIEDDQLRRDFTINALAISLNKADYGTVIDPFNGLDDMERKIIRTPCDPDVTFSDDPLRMMRAVRFASQLQFHIEEKTLAAIKENVHRMEIITVERVAVELNKILLSPEPSIGLLLMDETSLLERYLPELTALKGVEQVAGVGHKDNFYHTLQVVDHVALSTRNPWLIWTALLHDIGKAPVKRFVQGEGWTFYGHNHVGARMVEKIFLRLKLPLNEHMKYVQKLVELHMRPIALVEDEVTDSAVRRLLFDAGDDIDDLMLLAESDITSKNPAKVQRLLANSRLVRKKLQEVEEKDAVRNFQPPVSGEEIMQCFDLKPCSTIGHIKSAIKEAILDGVIQNNHEEALAFMYKIAPRFLNEETIK